MFETLPASITPRVPRSRPVLLAMVAHVLVLGVAVGGTSSPPVEAPAARLDTIRLMWTDVEPPPRNDVRPDEFVPHPPPLPTIRFDAAPLRAEDFKFQPPEPGIVSRFVPRPDGALLANARKDTTPVISMPVDVDQLPELIEELHPRYPAGLERAGVSGLVQLEYVVGPNGQVDLNSVRVVSITHPGFLLSAMEALRTARFRPARRGDVAVAVVVQQTIRFRQQ